MLSIENPPSDPSCSSHQVSQLNSSTDVLQSDLLVSCPKFTIRDYAFSNRSKDMKTNWPFSEKSLQLCLNHGVKDLLPPFHSLDAEENECHLIDQVSRPSNHLLPVHTSLGKSEGVRNFSSMVLEAETSRKYSASKPVKKLTVVAKKAENIMKPLIKKCNTGADKNKLENNTSNNFLVSETMASKVCPVCKTFTSSSNTTLNAHIDQCLSGESISQWTSDAKVTKSKVKPKRMRSMVEIYETAKHCSIEELEIRNGINSASCSRLPAQDMKVVDVVERKRKSPFDPEETENEGAVYVDTNGTKLRILSKLNDMASPRKARDDTGTRRHVDGNKSSKLCFSKKKKKKLHEKHHKLQIQFSDRKNSCSPRHHQNSQIIGIQEHPSGPEEHLEVEEAVKNMEPESVGRGRQSGLTKMNDKGEHLHPTWTSKKKLVGVNDMEPSRYSSVNGFRSKNKDDLRNKLNPMTSLSIQKVKMKRTLSRNVSGVGDNWNHIPNGHDLSSKSRGFSSFTKKQASTLFKPEASAVESKFGAKSKRADLKRPRPYCESESDGEAKTSDNLTLGRRAFKLRRDGGKIKVSGKGTKSTSKHREPRVDGRNDSYSDNVTSGSDDENETVRDNVQPCEKDVFDEATCSTPFFEASKELGKSSDVEYHEESRGYMKFGDGPSLGTEDARYPVESFFDGGEKLFYMNEDGQNVDTATELHSNDGSSSYCAEVDLIPIPGPPGSFLPSPSSNEFHGNSTPTSSQDQSPENLHEFPHRDSSDSPSPTSTICNSGIARFDSSLNEKLPFRHSGTMVDKIPLDPFQKDEAVLSSDVLSYQDASLLSWTTMPSVPASQVNFDTARRPKNCNLLLEVPSTGDPTRLIANKASTTNSGIKFLYTDGESASPSTPNSIFRLMGKDLMVVNNDETSYSHQTTKEKVVIDDASGSSIDLATDPFHGMGLMNHRRPSIASPGNFNPMYGYQLKTSHSGSLPLARTASFQVPPMGVNSSLPIKWNSIPRGSLPSSPSMRTTTPQSGGF